MTNCDNGKILVSRKLVIGISLAALWYMRKDLLKRGYNRGYKDGLAEASKAKTEEAEPIDISKAIEQEV